MVSNTGTGISLNIIFSHKGRMRCIVENLLKKSDNKKIISRQYKNYEPKNGGIIAISESNGTYSIFYHHTQLKKQKELGDDFSFEKQFETWIRNNQGTIYIFVRHGEGWHNIHKTKKYLPGHRNNFGEGLDSSIETTPLNMEELKSSGRLLNYMINEINSVSISLYCSDLQRTYQTAQIVLNKVDLIKSQEDNSFTIQVLPCNHETEKCDEEKVEASDITNRVSNENTTAIDNDTWGDITADDKVVLNLNKDNYKKFYDNGSRSSPGTDRKKCRDYKFPKNVEYTDNSDFHINNSDTSTTTTSSTTTSSTSTSTMENDNSYKKTIEDIFSKKINIDNKDAVLKILFTALYRSMNEALTIPTIDDISSDEYSTVVEKVFKTYQLFKEQLIHILKKKNISCKPDEWIETPQEVFKLSKSLLDKEIESTIYILAVFVHSYFDVNQTKDQQLTFTIADNNLDKINGVWENDKKYFKLKFPKTEDNGKLIMGFGPSASGKTHWAKNAIKIINKIDDSYPTNFLSIDGGFQRDVCVSYQIIRDVITEQSCSGFKNLMTAGMRGVPFTAQSIFDSSPLKKVMKSYLLENQVRPNLYVPETLGGCLTKSGKKFGIGGCKAAIYQDYITITNDKKWTGLLIWQHKNANECNYNDMYKCVGCEESGTKRQIAEGKKYSGAAYSISMSYGGDQLKEQFNKGHVMTIHNSGSDDKKSLIIANFNTTKQYISKISEIDNDHKCYMGIATDKHQLSNLNDMEENINNFKFEAAAETEAAETEAAAAKAEAEAEAAAEAAAEADSTSSIAKLIIDNEKLQKIIDDNDIKGVFRDNKKLQEIIRKNQEIKGVFQDQLKLTDILVPIAEKAAAEAKAKETKKAPLKGGSVKKKRRTKKKHTNRNLTGTRKR